jgi:Ca2+-binding EF-hand superfamily protein
MEFVMSDKKQSIFEELEADGLAALEEMRDAATHLKKHLEQQRRKRIVQVAKLNALGNIVFQELMEEIKRRTQR